MDWYYPNSILYNRSSWSKLTYLNFELSLKLECRHTRYFVKIINFIDHIRFWTTNLCKQWIYLTPLSISLNRWHQTDNSPNFKVDITENHPIKRKRFVWSNCKPPIKKKIQFLEAVSSLLNEYLKTRKIMIILGVRNISFENTILVGFMKLHAWHLINHSTASARRTQLGSIKY